MSRRAGSLRRALTATVITIVGVALTTLSTTAYVLYSQSVRERFDERITEAARAAAAVAVGRGAIQPTFLDGDQLPTLDQSRGVTSFQIWNQDGSVLARNPPHPSFVLPPPQPGPSQLETVSMPDGGRRRLYRAWLVLGPGGNAASAPPRVGVAVLRDTELLESRLARLRRILGASTIGTMFLSGVLAWLVIHRSVRAVARLSTRIGAIDAYSPGQTLDVVGLPEELRPPFAKVNDLLLRIEQVLNRERQFSADVSHELRTPLAGLRTILEVSGFRERTASEHRATLQEALEVVRQLEAIVENLLALARLGAGQLSEEQRELLDIGDLVDSCFRPLGEFAQRRQLQFENRIAPAVTVVADRVKLRLITSNLLSNSVQYTAEGGWISAESEPATGVILRVRDSGPPIPESALGKIFDPFFRADRARAGGEHFGIGLTLVRGLCESCGYGVAAENEPGGGVVFTITRTP